MEADKVIRIEVVDLVKEHFDRQRGILLGMIEAAGLDEKQERGLKSTLKTLSYQAQGELMELLEKQPGARA